MFFDVRGPFLKASMIFANFGQLGNFPVFNDLFKWKEIGSTNKLSFALVTSSEIFEKKEFFGKEGFDSFPETFVICNVFFRLVLRSNTF